MISCMNLIWICKNTSKCLRQIDINSANLEASASSLQEYPYQNVMFFDKCLANYLMNRQFWKFQKCISAQRHRERHHSPLEGIRSCKIIQRYNHAAASVRGMMRQLRGWYSIPGAFRLERNPSERLCNAIRFAECFLCVDSCMRNDPTEPSHKKADKHGMWKHLILLACCDWCVQMACDINSLDNLFFSGNF